MKANVKLEGLLILIMLIPVMCVAWVWKTLPDTIPIHFNLKGEANGYCSKTELLIFVPLINAFIYFLMRFIPRIDPKRKLDVEDKQYGILRLILSLFISAMSCFTIYAAFHTNESPNGLLFGLLSAFLIVLGNYIQTVKHNYFIGLKTPWALENADNWRYTHRLAGKFMVIAGVIGIFAAIFLPVEITGKILFASVLITVFIPFIFSYWYFAKNKKEVGKG